MPIPRSEANRYRSTRPSVCRRNFKNKKKECDRIVNALELNLNVFLTEPQKPLVCLKVSVYLSGTECDASVVYDAER